MNKNYFLLFLLSPFTFGQVGVNTDDPQATMEIKARTPSGTSTETDGIIIPNITRERAQNMENPSESTLIYISEATSGTANGKAIDIDEKGYYYYNGTKWVKLTTWDNINGTTHTFTNAIAHDQTTNLVKLGGNLIEPTTINHRHENKPNKITNIVRFDQILSIKAIIPKIKLITLKVNSMYATAGIPNCCKTNVLTCNK